MSVFQNSNQFHTILEALFAQIEAENGKAAESLLKSGLSFRFRLSEPALEMLIDARQRPLRITFGPSPTRPDLDVALAADTLHQILLGHLSIKKAMGQKLLVPKGPVWKTLVLADLFRQAQAIYPQILEKYGSETENH